MGQDFAMVFHMEAKLSRRKKSVMNQITDHSIAKQSYFCEAKTIFRKVKVKTVLDSDCCPWQLEGGAFFTCSKF